MKILIASPCGPIINRNFIECREDTVIDLQCMGHQVYSKFYSGPIISMNRNIAFIDACNMNVDWLIFIDTDMEFDPENVSALIHHHGEVVTGVCKTISGAYALYDYAPINNSIASIVKLESTVEICGGAFLAIKRGVLHLMNDGICRNREWRKVQVRDRTLDYPFNCVTFPNHVQAGEDTSFCLRLKELGIAIHIATDAIVGHEKIVCIR